MDKTLRILLLEDDDVLGIVVAQMLEHLGCDVVITDKGEDTLKEYALAMDAKPFDMVILDMVVDEGLGGEDTAKVLLELDANAHIVLTSGMGNAPLLNNYEDYGFKNVLKKPYVMDQLNRVLEPLVNQPTHGV